MHNSFRKITSILFLTAAALVLFGSGYSLGRKGKEVRLLNSTVKNKQEIDFTLFWKTWDTLEQKFVDKKKLDVQKMFYGAIKGMVAALDDPYTAFLTPDENKQTKDDLSGTFEGIGAHLGLKDNRVVVITPLKNSPAEKAGLLAGDIILKVNGQSTDTWTLVYTVSQIRGERGTKVTLTIARKGKEKQFEIVREAIQVASVETSFEREVAVLKLIKFGDDTLDVWDRAVEDISQKWKGGQVKGMVLDMRDNPGGYLQGAVYISSEFLQKDALVITQKYSDDKSEKYTVDHNGALQDIPLVVLINEGSASAAEIVAGALRDHKRAVLVGQKSFGKGSIQEALDFEGGAGLHVTIAKWILPNGDWINSKGIEAQVIAENPQDEANSLTRAQDLQLEKAIEEVLR